MATAKVMKIRVSHPRGFLRSFYNPEVHGVTFSLLSKFRNCRERARLHLLGWTPKRQSTGTLFGTFVHALLELIYLCVQKGELTAPPEPALVKSLLRTIHNQWRDENPKADTRTLQEVEMIALLVEAIMPIYFKMWTKDFTDVKWIALEHQFLQPGLLPKRGKMDGSFHPKDLPTQPWLFETKTKSRLGEKGESNLVDILGFELQVQLYLGVLQEQTGNLPRGVLYNIIRRPSMTQKKGETMTQFRERLVADIRKRPEYYFIRMRMSVDRRELAQQQDEIEELIRDFYTWAQGKAPHYRNSDHCENKYGSCEFLAICGRQDYSGLYQRNTVFRELDEV